MSDTAKQLDQPTPLREDSDAPQSNRNRTSEAPSNVTWSTVVEDHDATTL